jgi:hypothetical protein
MHDKLHVQYIQSDKMQFSSVKCNLVRRLYISLNFIDHEQLHLDYSRPYISYDNSVNNNRQLQKPHWKSRRQKLHSSSTFSN